MAFLFCQNRDLALFRVTIFGMENKEETLAKITRQISDNPILLYMKGTPEAPQCGFSLRAACLLSTCGHPFAHVNILENPDIRRVLPEYADWPTFPQLYVRGELVGGSDILQELFEAGELQLLLERAVSGNDLH